jgi:ADP-heptose:LPS heptosyltransferase
MNDQRRSLPASYLKPLLDMKGVDFISLNPALADGVARAGLPNLIQAVHFGDDFLRTAEVISTLDLVITVDSAPAHLAGSLGVPVWTLLPHEPDWRWDLNSKTTPWYPSMRLYRQQTPGDWTGVIAMVTKDLKSRQTANPGE